MRARRRCRIPHVKTRLVWSRVGLGALAGLVSGAVAVGAGTGCALALHRTPG